MYLLLKIGISAAIIVAVSEIAKRSTLFIRRGVSFYPALGVSCACTVLGYIAMSLVLQRFGVKV